jgi:hypothetical protein
MFLPMLLPVRTCWVPMQMETPSTSTTHPTLPTTTTTTTWCDLTV